MRNAETIATEIKGWNKQDVRELRKLLVELSEVCDEAADSDQYATPFDAYVDMTVLPSEEIPADVDTAYPIWAMDKSGRLLAGACVSELEIITLKEYREAKAA